MIAIIGGGISGLALAYFLQQNGRPYVLLEAGAQVGGVIQSKKIGDYWVEIGPNSLLCDAHTLNFMDRLGIAGDLVPANAVSKNRYIFRNGAYRVLPDSPPALLKNKFFSWKTKFSIFREFFKGRKGARPHETLSQFISRRFSQEIVDYALDPFVAGIYAGDPQRLLIEYTFPKLLEYERQYGSVLKGFSKNKLGARKVTYSFKQGMQQLPQAMAKGLNIKLHTPVQQIERSGSGYSLHTPAGVIAAADIALALPAPAAASLLQAVHPAYAQALANVRYAPMSAVHSVFSKAAVGFELNGFGGLNPRKEGLFTAGHIWSSSVFAGKCPEHQVLFSSFVGGDQNPERAGLDDATLKRKVAEELQAVYQIKEGPVWQHIARWQEALPQYDEALHALKHAEQSLKQMGIYPCANWYGGVSIPDCIEKGQKLAFEIGEKRG